MSLEALFSEDKSMDHKRRQLQDTKGRLEKALKVLSDPGRLGVNAA